MTHKFGDHFIRQLINHPPPSTDKIHRGSVLCVCIDVPITLIHILKRCEPFKNLHNFQKTIGLRRKNCYKLKPLQELNKAELVD